MAPTLKEVDAAGSKAVLLEAAHAATPALLSESTIGAVRDGIHEPPRPELSVLLSTATSNPAPAAMAHLSPPLQHQPQPSQSPPMKPLVEIVECENPSDIPPDESAFLIQPHFSRHNAFHRSLSNLDLSMRCAICSELYHAPVTLIPCMHSFCSLCVRNHFKSTYTGMKRKVECPKCNEPVRMPGSTDYEKGILPNKQLEQLVDAYTQCRDPLRKSLVQLDVLKKQKGLGLSTDTKRVDRQVKSVHKTETRNHDEDESIECEIRSSKRIKKGGYSSDSDYEELDQTSSNHMNMHRHHQLKRRPTVNYHSLKKKQLVELCCKEGLSTYGSDAELKKRHSDFITLYNSECDSNHPRSVKVLLAEIRNKEATIKREAQRTCTNYQSASRDPAFNAKLNKNFAEMITTLKKQKESRVSLLAPQIGAPNACINGADHTKLVDRDIGIPVLQQRSAPITQNDNSNSDTMCTIDASTVDIHNNVESPIGVLMTGEENMDRAKSMFQETSSFSMASMKSPGHRSVTVAAAPTNAIGATQQGDESVQMTAKTPKVASPVNLSTTLRYGSITKPSASKISSLGPWICRTCTFNNLRNITKKARCEMCDAIRPISFCSNDDRRSAEVVNIEC